MTDDPSQSRRHAFKSKWNKILKSDDGDGKGYALESNVSDFLRGTQQPLQGVPAPPPMSTRPDKSPRIDVSIAQRWPDATQLRSPSTLDFRVPSPIPAEVTGRPRKRKGLTVRFSSEQPEIMGYGGEEARIPPIEIARNRPVAVRAESDRRPVEFTEASELAHERPHIRPGMTDRAQTTHGSEAYSRLAAAGIFADRAPSHDGRQTPEEDGLQPGYAHGNRQDYTSPEGPSRSESGSPQPPLSQRTPPRGAPRVPVINAPDIAIDLGNAHDIVGHSASGVHLPLSVRKQSQDELNRNRQRMRQEEGRAFSQAFRLSQGYPDEQDSPRPSSQGSNTSPGEHRSPRVPEHIQRGMYLASPASSSQESLVVRKKPSPSPSRTAQIHDPQISTQPTDRSAMPPERQGPPVGRGGMSPQDYIEFFKAKTASRSNSAARALKQEQPEGPHDSPQQMHTFKRRDEPAAGVQAAQPDTAQPRQNPQPARPVPMQPPPARDVHARRPVAAPVNMPKGALQGGEGAGARAGTTPAAVSNSSKIVQEAQPVHQKSRSTSVDSVQHSSPNTPSRKVDPRGVASFDDFATRVNQMRGVFRLTAEKERFNQAISTRQWLRCAYWWLHKGKLELDTQARTTQRGPLTQGHVNVAKAWWILVDVMDDGPSLTDANDANDTNGLRFHLRSLCLSMNRQDLMPPHAALIQGQDTTIWVKYPQYPPDVEYLLGCTAQTTVVGDVLPPEDTNDYFFYQRILATGSTNTDETRSDRMRLPCVLSILRHKLHYRTSILVASQNELVNVLVGPDLGKEKQGPTWYDIQWKAKSSSFSIQLPRGLILNLSVNDEDYRALSNMLEFTRSMDKSFNAGPSEVLTFKTELYEAQYTDRGRSHSFPNDGKVRKACLEIFEDMRIEKWENITRKAHHAYRLLLITPSTSRTLGAVNHVYDAGSAFDLEFPEASPEIPGPAVIIHSPDKSRPWRLLLDFDSKPAFSDFLDVLQGTFKTADEYTKLNLSIKTLSADPIGPATPQSTSLSALKHLQWRDATIVTRRNEKPVTVLSDSLRVILNHRAGSVVDRLNFLPGELLLRLAVATGDSANSIELARLPQLDVQVVVNRAQTLPATLEKLLDIGRALSSTPTIRQLSFATRADLHAFEQELTGYRVSFDATPSLFSITRRTKVVTLHKKLEASRVRLQVLSGGGDLRVVAAFFEDFPAADALVFEVRASNEFERIKGDKQARFGVKIIEAKFSMPKDSAQGDPLEPSQKHGIPGIIRRRFLNLEGLEYAEEHDDIVVGFEHESDADGFCDALPGTVHAAGRNFLSRRRN